MKTIDNEYDLAKLIVEKQASFYSKGTSPVLYHGTDLSVIEMDELSRKKLLEACELIARYLRPIYEENKFYERISEFKNKTSDIYIIADACSCAGGIINNNPQFSYGNLYLTSDASKAVSYAKKSWICGELGYIAYYMHYGCEILGLKQPDNKDYCDARRVLLSKTNIKKPCILIYTEIPNDDIELDNGKQIVFKSPDFYNMVRFKKGKEISFDSAVMISEELFEKFIILDKQIKIKYEDMINQIKEEILSQGKI